MKVTFETIRDLSCSPVNITLNAHQLRLLGIAWPPKRGWVTRLIGKDIPVETLQAAADLKGVSKKVRRKILSDCGQPVEELFGRKLKVYDVSL